MNFIVLLEFLAAAISLITAILPIIIKQSTTKKPSDSISINGDNNDVYQDNSVHKQKSTTTYIDERVYISSSPQESATSDDIGLIAIGGIVLLIFLFKNRYILLDLVYIPLLVAAFLNILIVVFYKMRKSLLYIYPKMIFNVLFLITPFLISVLFILQNRLFLSNLEIADLAGKSRIGLAILFDYLGAIILQIAQLCELIGPHIKSSRIKRVLLNLFKLWPSSIILPSVSFLLFLSF